MVDGHCRARNNGGGTSVCSITEPIHRHAAGDTDKSGANRHGTGPEPGTAGSRRPDARSDGWLGPQRLWPEPVDHHPDYIDPAGDVTPVRHADSARDAAATGQAAGIRLVIGEPHRLDVAPDGGAQRHGCVWWRDDCPR